MDTYFSKSELAILSVFESEKMLIFPQLNNVQKKILLKSLKVAYIYILFIYIYIFCTFTRDILSSINLFSFYVALVGLENEGYVLEQSSGRELKFQSDTTFVLTGLLVLVSLVVLGKSLNFINTYSYILTINI